MEVNRTVDNIEMHKMWSLRRRPQRTGHVNQSHRPGNLSPPRACRGGVVHILTSASQIRLDLNPANDSSHLICKGGDFKNQIQNCIVHMERTRGAGGAFSGHVTLPFWAMGTSRYVYLPPRDGIVFAHCLGATCWRQIRNNNAIMRKDSLSFCVFEGGDGEITLSGHREWRVATNVVWKQLFVGPALVFALRNVGTLALFPLNYICRVNKQQKTEIISTLKKKSQRVQIVR